MRIHRSVVSGVWFGVACVWISPAVASDVATEQAPEVDVDAIASAPSLELDVLVRAVLERNPNVAAARLAWQAAAKRPLQAGVLEQPTVSYGFAPLSLGSSVPFGQEIAFSQRLPRGSTRELHRNVARAEAGALENDLEATRLELARAAGLLLADYSFAAEALRLNSEHVDLLEDLQRSATSRYAAGLGSQQDPLQAEAELAHVLHDQVVLRSEQRIVAARINTLLDRAPDAPLPPPPSLGASDREASHDPQPASGNALSTPVAEERPEVRALGLIVEARRGDLTIAQRAGRPEPTVMASYNSMWSDSEHRWMMAASWSVPLWRKGLRAGVSRAEERLAEAEARLAARELEVEGDVWQATERLRESEHVLELYVSRMLPAARDRLKAATTGLSAGTNDFAAVIEAERGLRQVELGYREALAERERHAVELGFASGRLTDSHQSKTNQGSIAPGDPS